MVYHKKGWHKIAEWDDGGIFGSAYVLPKYKNWTKFDRYVSKIQKHDFDDIRAIYKQSVYVIHTLLFPGACNIRHAPVAATGYALPSVRLPILLLAQLICQ